VGVDSDGLGCQRVGLGLGLRMGLGLGLGLGLQRGRPAPAPGLDQDQDQDLRHAFREPQRTRTNGTVTPTRRRIRPRRVRTRGSFPVPVRRACECVLELALARGRRPSRVSPGCDTCSVRWYSLPFRDRTLRRGRRRHLRVRRRRREGDWWVRGQRRAGTRMRAGAKTETETENRGIPLQARSRVPRDSQGAARRPRLLRRARSGCPSRNWRRGYSRLASEVRLHWKAGRRLTARHVSAAEVGLHGRY
jgi:hypothetical protein